MTTCNRSFVRKCIALVALAALLATIAAAEGAEWGYEKANGPEHWGDVAPICAQGDEQSPIDFVGEASTHAAVRPISFNWLPFMPDLLNNGHTIVLMANSNGGNGSVGRTEYQLLQIHFYHLSEHTFSGKHRAIEAHMVHRSEQGDIVVVAATFVEGDESRVLGSIGPVNDAVGKMVSGTTEIDPKSLLPAEQSAYRYKGSLTTPGCFEVVTWHVLENPVTASAAQIKSFAKIFPNNYRPVQDLGRRYVLYSQ